MRLKVGQPAPVFTQRDMYDRTVSLAQYWGRRVLLSFNRAAVCPLCNLRLHYLIDHHDDYRRRGLEIIAFFESSPEMARRYLERQRPAFPIIPDLGRVVYEQYGMESSLFGALKARLTRGSAYREAARYHIGGNFWYNLIHMDGAMGRRPADFLLSGDLRIQMAYYGHDSGDFLPFVEIDRFLATPAEPPFASYGQAPTPRYPGAGYPGYADRRGPNSGRSYPGYPGQSAPGQYPSGPSGPSRPEIWRSGGPGHSGWPGGSDNSGNSGW